MAHTVMQNAGMVFAILHHGARDRQYSGKELVDATKLISHEVNDVVAILGENGYAEWQRYLGTVPFVFGFVGITPRGRVGYERATQAKKASQGHDRSLRGPSSVAVATAVLLR
jgi:hypothetical protein